jgi:hypothetical protein
VTQIPEGCKLRDQEAGVAPGLHRSRSPAAAGTPTVIRLGNLSQHLTDRMHLFGELFRPATICCSASLEDRTAIKRLTCSDADLGILGGS